MLRAAMMLGVVALCCAGVAQSAEAREQMGLSQGSFGARGSARFQSPRFERREPFSQNRRFFVHRRFDRDRDDRFFFRDRFRFGDGFGFGFGGWPYYPYDTGYYPYPSAAPPEGPIPYAALGPPPTQTADLPPCRESGPDGVVIMRGTACSRGKP